MSDRMKELKLEKDKELFKEVRRYIKRVDKGELSYDEAMLLIFKKLYPRYKDQLSLGCKDKVNLKPSKVVCPSCLGFGNSGCYDTCRVCGGSGYLPNWYIEW